MKYLLLLLMSVVCYSTFALDVHLKSLNNNNRKVVAQFIEETVGILPKIYSDQIQEKISISFEYLDGENKLSKEKLCYGQKREHSLGRAYPKKYKIILHRGLLKYIVDSNFGKSQKIPCKHGNIYDLAKGVLIHEISHIFDFDYQNYEENKIVEHPFLSKGEGPDLKYSSLHNNHFSSMPSYLYLNGWSFSHLRQLGPVKKVKKARYSPDFYEYSDNIEHFAVNMQFFLLDPEYKCRRPEQYNYLEKKLMHTPFLNIECSNKIIYPTTNFGNVGVKSFNLDNVREIHYLHAGKAEALMSRWGHSMFRIVLCPKNEDIKKCRISKGKNLVLNFSAYIPDFTINSLKGLSGGYESVLSITDFEQTIIENTHLENRNMYSFPLDLTTDQKRAFARLAVQRVWGYIGEYRFLSNNCADEALDFLKAVTKDKRLWSKFVTTPIGLRNLLISTKFIINENNLEKAKKEHLFFPRELDSILISYTEVKRLLFNEGDLSFDEFSKLTPKERSKAYSNVSDKLSLVDISNIILIERFLFIDHFSNLQKNKISSLQKLHNSNESREQIDFILSNIKTDPHREFSLKTYGLPLSFNEILVPNKADEDDILELVDNMTSEIFSSQNEELTKHRELLQWLKGLLYR